MLLKETFCKHSVHDQLNGHSATTALWHHPNHCRQQQCFQTAGELKVSQNEVSYSLCLCKLSEKLTE